MSGHDERRTSQSPSSARRRAVPTSVSLEDPDFSRILLDIIANLVVVLDRHGRIMRFNHACETTTGWRETEVLGRPLWDVLVVPEEVNEVKSVFATITAGHFPNRHENDWLTRTGERRRIAWSNSALVGADNEVTYVIATGIDVTEERRLRRTEEALQESELRFRAMFDNTFQMVGLLDTTGILLDINQTALAMVGIPIEQVLGKPFWETPWWSHSSDEGNRLRDAIACAATGLFVRYTLLLPLADGSQRFIDFSLRPLRSPDGTVRFLISEGRDITDLRRLDETLRESERRYRLLFENLNSGLALHEIICDAQGQPVDFRFLEVNPAYERITGLSATSIVGHTILEVAPAIERHWINIFGRVALTGDPVEVEDYFATLGRWIEVRAFSPSRGRFATLYNDITDRRKAEEKSRAREEDLAITLRSIGDAVIATDAAGRVTRLNHVAETITGWTASEAVGKPLSEVFHIINADTRRPVESPVAKALRLREVVDLAKHTLLVARDGRERQIADSAAPIRDDRDSIRGVVLVFRDVTEQCRLEDQFRQAQKMETVGRLAGGVAHDFNNLLTGILGYADLLAMRLRDDTRSCQQISTIREAAERASDLTRQLLAFSRKGKRMSVGIDMHHLIAGVAGILQRTLDPRISVIQRLEANNPQVLGDPAQLQSALLNLTVNARDAMPDGGVLTIASTEVMIDKPLHLGHGQALMPGRYVQVAVIDTGIGMGQEVLEHLFEPFFTTKPVGEGTGLGMAAVYGTIREHQGGILVASTPGSGTVCTLYLPTSEQASRPSTEGLAPIPGHGRILLVDDEPLLRRLGSELLTTLGYEVMLAADGREAVELFRREPGAIAAVVLDVVMPHISGPEAFRQMRAIDPDVKVLMISGFGADAEALLHEGVRGFVGKPFNAAELSRALASAIAPKPA